jgi:hypothetical protein
VQRRLQLGQRLGLAVGVGGALGLLHAQIFGGVLLRQLHQLDLVAAPRHAQFDLHAAMVGQPLFQHGAIRRQRLHQDQAGHKGRVVVELLDEGADQRALLAARLSSRRGRSQARSLAPFCFHQVGAFQQESCRARPAGRGAP